MPVKQPSQMPLPWQSTCHQVGPNLRPAGVHAFPAALGRGQACSQQLFFPTLQEGYCIPQDDLSFTASTELVPATPAVTASKIRPLTSPLLMPELGGTPVEAAYTPAVPATVRAIRTFCILLHALEMYSPFVNNAHLCI
jgi:hypothetical protein